MTKANMLKSDSALGKPETSPSTGKINALLSAEFQGSEYCDLKSLSRRKDKKRLVYRGCNSI